MRKEVISLSVLVAVASLGAVSSVFAEKKSGEKIVQIVHGNNDVGDNEIVTDHSKLTINDDTTNNDITNDYAHQPENAGWSNSNAQREDMLQDGGDVPIVVGVANSPEKKKQNAANAATLDISQ